ncbi:hypothetical protein I312_101411 [Cryptococcus bacillisporus CA1280]|uniref:uncharacterized protein n=1 Tax=Cryptococcus bacillisporus CA1280 TaxID=1296109 RepID=UPI0033671CD7
MPPSIHSWLHPHDPPPTLSHSPPLHHSSSTFLTFTISFLPPSHVTTEASLAKEARRIEKAPFRQVKAELPDALLEKREQGNQIIEWEEAFQLVESFSDDGEKFGGERVLKVLREQNAVDVLSVCCRWYGGDMIGPIRFQHIATTVQTSLRSLLELVQLRDLRQALDVLDEEIASLRAKSINLGSSQTGPSPSMVSSSDNNRGTAQGKYDSIQDVTKLERLVSAKEKTVAVLLKKQTSTSA